MKLFLTLALLLPIFAFAKKIPTYSVSYVKDAAVSATQTKVVIHCDQFSTAEEGDLLHYGANEYSSSLPAVVEQAIGTELPAGKYVFSFYYTSQFDEIETDSIEVKAGYVTRIRLHFFNAERPVQMKKPVIYLYPESDTEVEVTVGTENGLSFSYPAYDNGWKGTAHPDGSMTIEGKTYPYLFWEADKVLPPSLANRADGFIIERDQVVAFLETQLTRIGLTAQEQTDFITFWGPQLIQHERVYLNFIFNEEVNQLATLELSVPAKINRLYMIWSSEIPDVNTSLRTLPVFDRSGFDVLEWGGMELPPRLVETTNAR